MSLTENLVITELETQQLQNALQQLIIDHPTNHDSYTTLANIISHINSDDFYAPILSQLYKLMGEGGILDNLSTFGHRSAIPVITILGGTEFVLLNGQRTPIGIAARMLLGRMTLRTDSAMSDFRNNGWIMENADYNPDSLRLGYRTVSGAIMPSSISGEDARELMAAMHSPSEATIPVISELTDSIEYMNVIDTKYLDDEGYSYLPQEEVAKIAFASELQFHTKLPHHKVIEGSHHAKQRLGDYGIKFSDANMLNMFRSENAKIKKYLVKGKVQSGRSVLNTSLENSKNVDGTYLVIAELYLELRCMIKGEHTKIPVTVIVSGYVKPVNRAGVNITLGEHVSNESEYDPLKIQPTFIITIIPGEDSMPDSTLVATGFPVIPSYIPEKSEEKDRVVMDIGSGSKLSAQTLKSMTDSFRETDQWLNLPHALVGNTPMSKEELRVQITKYGVEFEDVENIKADPNSRRVYDLLAEIGFTYISIVSGTPMHIVKTWWGKLKVGPSITHSHVIRFHNSPFNGTKPFTRIDLLVRFVLSKMFSVGEGRIEETFDHELGIKIKVPRSIHMFNEKVAEALMVPLCVTKKGMFVYTLSVGLARMISRINDTALDTASRGESELSRYKRANIHKHREIMEDGTPRMIKTFTGAARGSRESVMFMTKALPIEVDEVNTSRFSVVFPNGKTYSMCLIISDIIRQLKETMGVANMNVVVWHPLFSVIVSQTVVPTLSYVDTVKHLAVVLPAVRKSTLAPPYHNDGYARRESSQLASHMTHYARLNVTMGYVGGFLDHLELDELP